MKAKPEAETDWPTQPDLSPPEHLLKLIDLMPCICQTVIQARGDLGEDRGSIVKMSLCISLLSKLLTPKYSKIGTLEKTRPAIEQLH